MTIPSAVRLVVVRNRPAVLAAVLLIATSLSASPTDARASTLDPDDLWLGYAEGPYLQPGPSLRDVPLVRWEVLDPRTLADGRLALTVRVTAPPVDLPVEAGPGVLLGDVSLYGDAGGDVGLWHTFPTVARKGVAPACQASGSCVYEGHLVLPTDLIGPYLRRPVVGRWQAVTVGLTLVRTFDQGRWIQVLPMWVPDDALAMTTSGRLGDARPFRGVSSAFGLLSRDQVRRWDRAGGDRRDRRGLLDITERTRRRVGDASARTPTVSVELSLDPADCPRGMTLSSKAGAIAFDRAAGGNVERTVELPVGRTWTVTVPSLDRIEIPSDDTLLTFGPFGVGSSPARLLGAWGCVGAPSGDVTCTGCVVAGPTSMPEASATPVPGPIGPSPLGPTPSSATGLEWQEATLGGSDTRLVDVTAHGTGFAALGVPWDAPRAIGSPRVWMSDTGVDWRVSSTSFAGVDGRGASLDRIVDLAGRLVAIGRDGARLMAWYSDDGTSWRRARGASLAPSSGGQAGIRPGLVIDGVAVSTDQRLLVVAHAPRGVSGAVRRAWASDDGRRWEHITPTGLGSDVVRAVSAGPAGFLAVGTVTEASGTRARLLASPDGVAWRSIGDLPVGADRVVWDGIVGRYVAGGRLALSGRLEAAAVWTSVDGVAWRLAAHTWGAALIDLTLLVSGPTIVLATPGFHEDMGWSWWSALVSTDGGATWQVSAGWPVQGEVLCPAVGAAGPAGLVVGGCGRPSVGVARVPVVGDPGRVVPRAVGSAGDPAPSVGG